MSSEEREPRPFDTLKVFDERGYTYLPQNIRRELGVEGKDEVPFVVDANCVLMMRKGAKLSDILEGLEILKKDLKLRSR